MRSEIKCLTLLELRNLYGWNKFRHTRDNKEKQRYIALAVVWIFLIATVVSYVGGLSYGLVMLGVSEIVPAYLTMIASVLILVFGIFKAGNMILSQKGYDLLCSLPVKQTSIVMSRFLAMYAEDLLLTLLIMLPGVTIYGCCVRPAMMFYGIMTVGMFFVPLLPLVIATLIGTVITAIASQMKHKSIVQAFLMILLVVGVTISSLGIDEMAEEFTPELLINFADTITQIINKMYPPAVWLGNAAVYGKIADFMLFVVISLIAILGTIVFVSRNFHGISQKMLVTSAKHNYHMETLNSSGMLFALFIREWKRYFSSSIYVMNTIIGPILATIMSAGILITGMDYIQNRIPLQLDIAGLIPFLFAAVFSMMTTTSVSISMEGKQFWIVKTLPVSTKMLLDSKILLNISLILPFYLISEICLILALKPAVLEVVWIILIPACLIMFGVVIGISINLKLHSFDWEKEEIVVKQSASAMLGGFAGFVFSIFFAALVYLLPAQFSNITRAVICISLCVVTLFLYSRNNQVNLQKL